MPDTENGALVIRGRVFNRTDTESNWNTANPLLGRGEIAVALIGPTVTKVKIGDGANNYRDLPYANDDLGDFEIHAAVPSTNPGAPVGNRIYETATAGTYTNFKDINGASIVVAAGQYVRLIDEGAYWSKVVLPISSTGLVTDADARRWVNSLYNLDYIEQPDRGAAVDMLNIYAGTSTSTAVPQVGHWYVDMRQSFDISRLDSVEINGALGTPGGIGGGPADESYVYAQIVTISPTGVITFLGSPAGPETVVATFTGVIDLSAQAAALTAAGTRTAYGRRGYVAIRTQGTGLGLDTVGLIGPVTGNQVWQFTNAAGNARIAKLMDVGISYVVQLHPTTTINEELNLSRLKTAVTIRSTAVQAANTPYYVAGDDTTIYFNTTGWTAAAEVILPRFNVEVGKIFIVMLVGGTQPVQVKGVDVAVNVAGSVVNLAAVGQRAWFQYTTSGYFQIA